MSLGLTLGQISANAATLIVLVGVFTMVISTYFDRYSNRIYTILSSHLNFFEKKNVSDIYISKTEIFSNHIVLIGCDRTGRNLLSYFKKKQIPFVVIDFNPEIISRLNKDKIPFVFGDASDPEILVKANISSSRCVVSTISSLNENLLVLSEFSKKPLKPISIFTAATKNDALRLYEKGASYVVVPENAASEHIRYILQTYFKSKTKLRMRGKHHFERLMAGI